MVGLWDSSRLTGNQGSSGPQAQFYLRRDRRFGSRATGEHSEHLLYAPGTLVWLGAQAPTSTLCPRGSCPTLNLPRAFWRVLCSLQVILVYYCAFIQLV